MKLVYYTLIHILNCVEVNFNIILCVIWFQFGWTHVTLLIVVTQSHLIIQNVFEGLVWYDILLLCLSATLSGRNN